MNDQTGWHKHRGFPGIWGKRKRWCFPIAVWLFVFALAAAGFPAAVLGQELQALSQPEGNAISSLEPPVYTPWQDFRSSFGTHNHALALEAGAIAVDGSLEDWQPYAELQLPGNTGQIQMSGWAGPEDVSASVYLAYDNDYFYWAAKVTDNVHTPVADSTMWRGDSIQFAFSPDGTYGPEYGINYMDGQAHVWQFSEGKATAGASLITAAAVQNGNETVYEVRMPWSTIYTGKPETDVLPFTMLFNDNDGAGRRGWVEWTAGIGKAKSPPSHAQVHLIPAGADWSFWVEGPKEVPVSATVQYAVYAVNWESAPVTLQLKSEALGADRSLTIPGRTVAEVRLPFAPDVAGDHPLDFALTASGGGRQQQDVLLATAVMTPAEVEARLDAVAAKLPQLEGLLLQCEAQGLSTDYERINYTVIKDFIGYGKEDIVKERLSRAYYVAVELEKLYDEAAGKLQGYLDGSGTPQSAPRYVTGRPAISGYSFVGDTVVRSTGAVEERPIFFTGYGAFTKVREDIPKFQDLGANAIQVEIGPRDVILDKTDFINQYSVSRAGNVSASAAVVEGVSHSGSHSLQISNSSPYQSNVYMNVAQTIAVEPNTTYQFKVWVKGNNARNTWFPGGSSMKQRKSFPSGTYDWQEVDYEYTTGPQETSYKLMVVSENTGIIWVDDLWVGKAGSSVNLVDNSGFEDLGGFSAEKEYVVSTKKIQSDIVRVLQNAANNQVAVNLLVSPHYFPAWALAKWPELGISSNGFIKFSVFHPMAQAIIEDYLRALIPLVEPYGSLHSITLTNESVYQTNKDPYALPFWHSYLEELYGGDIGELNRVYGSSYAAFGDVPMPENVSASPWAYDYVMFNNDYFARWHEWMAGIIHELAPDLPVQAKIMGDPRGSLSWGVDIERFSEFSQINGNDNWNYINEGPKGFMEELSFYDMQASFKEAPVFNSEHHMIADGDKVYSPEQAKHVRSVLWQSAIHGRGGSTIWVWERTYDEASSREGSILHRPDAVAEVGRTNLDLNRLAREVTAFQNQAADAAILYSVPAGIFSGDYSNVLLRSYEALSFSGQKAGFVTEKQIAAGGLSAYKLLVVPYATRVDAATLSGIKAYMEQGGRVLLIGSHALELEPHGAAQSAEERSYVFAHADKITAADWTAAQIRGFLQPILQEIAPERMVLKESVTGELPYNVEWRSTAYEGKQLLNIVNYGAETVFAAAEAGGSKAVRYTNLITGQVHEGAVLELEPLTPYLFAVDMGAGNGDGGGGAEPGNGGGQEPGNGNGSGGENGGGTDPGSGGEAGGSTNPGTGEESGGNTNPGTGEESGGEANPGTGGEAGGNTNPGTGEESGGEANPGSGAGQESGNGSSAVEAPAIAQPVQEKPDAGQPGAGSVVSDPASGIRLNGDPAVKYISGYEDGTFRPDQPVTRAEFARLLYSLAMNGEKEMPIADSGFSDVPADSWYGSSVAYLAAKGLLAGYEDGTFRPGGPLTRAEAAWLLARFIQESGAAAEVDFADTAGHWAEKAVRHLAARGILSGYPDGGFHPDQPLTRAETVVLLNRILGRSAVAAEAVIQEAAYKDLPAGHWAYAEIVAAAAIQ